MHAYVSQPQAAGVLLMPSFSRCESKFCFAEQRFWFLAQVHLEPVAISFIVPMTRGGHKDSIFLKDMPGLCRFFRPVHCAAHC